MAFKLISKNTLIVQLIPTSTSSEIMAHLEEGDLVEFFATRDNLLITKGEKFTPTF
jgi:hypothetical protein|tara:strand:- start:4705 stop:4872 length:168 start_codon:yes stop_codon:yes gene_type:complete